MKKIYFALATSLHVFVHAQNVGINAAGTAPNTSAMLDVESTTRGLLIPRVALTAVNAAGPITSPATSLLVYNTATAGTAPNDVTPGYYFWNGSSWTRLATGANDDWKLTGNAGTSAANNFIGTTDAIDFVARTNNTERLRVTSAGNVGIGNNSPSERLDVTGNVEYSGALMPNNLPGTTGQILTSGGANNPSVWLGQGTSGQFLTSAGAGAAPSWGELGQSSTTYFNTGGIALVSASWTYATGFPVTITVPANCKTMVSVDIGVLFQGTNANNQYCDIALFVDGAFTIDGGYYRTAGSGALANVDAWKIVNMTQTFNLSAGSHTLGVIGIKSTNGAVTFGGDGTSVLQGEMTVTFIKN